jgi:hypothetical protein
LPRREQLGGYYMLACRDLDEAVELARKVPVAVAGSIEVRPVMELAGARGDRRTTDSGEAS